MKKLKEWQICLIKNWESYTNNTYRQIAEFCNAPSDEAVRSFWRRNKSLFEKETLNHKWDALVEEMDNYNDRIDGFEVKVTNKPVEIVDTNMPKIHVVIGCCHIPFHDKKLMEAFIEFLGDNATEIASLNIIGDFLDLNTLSSHDKGKFTAIKGLTLDQEYDAGNDILDIFDDILPKSCVKRFLFGNHEARYFRWMANTDNAKTPLVSPTDGLRLRERGYEVKEDWMQDFITLGHLDLMHGIFYNVHSAKTHLDRFRCSVAYVHTHRIQSFIEGDMGAWNLGWMGDVNSLAFSYASRATKSQWKTGFGVVSVEKDNTYYVNQIIANNGKFVYGGKIYG